MDKNNDIKFQNKKLDWDTPMLIKLSERTENLYGGCVSGGNDSGGDCVQGTAPGATGLCYTVGISPSGGCSTGQLP